MVGSVWGPMLDFGWLQYADDLSLLTRVLDGAKRRQTTLEKDKQVLERDTSALQMQIDRCRPPGMR